MFSEGTRLRIRGIIVCYYSLPGRRHYPSGRRRSMNFVHQLAWRCTHHPLHQNISLTPYGAHLIIYYNLLQTWNYFEPRISSHLHQLLFLFGLFFCCFRIRHLDHWIFQQHREFFASVICLILFTLYIFAEVSPYKSVPP